MKNIRGITNDIGLISIALVKIALSEVFHETQFYKRKSISASNTRVYRRHNIIDYILTMLQALVMFVNTDTPNVESVGTIS